MKRWQNWLAEQDQAGMRRTLRTVEGPQGGRVTLSGREVLLLCSNDYLGLAAHPAVVEAARQALARFGVGSGASRLVSGTMTPHVELEEALAEFKQTEAALLFNSGFAANTGILQALLEPGDVVFSDQLNHASIVDGCRLSSARTVVYPHGDAATLEELMTAEAADRRGRWLIVTDGVFSMDGDLAPLPELCRLRDRFEALLMVDDAHGTGVLGAHGRGTAEHFGCQDRVDLHMGTLGKALGSAGAYLAGSRVAVEVLVNRSRPFIFSTSLPPAVPAAGLAALKLVRSEAGVELRQRLQDNRTAMVSRLERHGIPVGASRTQILPILTGDPEPTMAAAARLLEEGIFLQGIRPPTVPVGRCRLRATVMANHHAEELTGAADRIAEIVGGLSS